MSRVTWEDPPPVCGPESPNTRWMEVLRPMVDHEGRWARIGSGVPSAMHSAAERLKMRQVHIPPGAWEFRVRTFRRGVHVKDNNTAVLYGRYLGPDPALTVGGYWANIAAQAPRDEHGRRVCRDCGAPVHPLTPLSTRPPLRCPDCWRQLDTKWSRKKYGTVDQPLDPAHGGDLTADE